MEIEFQNVSVQFNTLNVLSDLNLKLRPKERIAIIGPSGSGKSTIAKLALGLLTPTSGTILHDAQPMKRDQVVLPAQIGYVAQTGGLFQHLSILQNLALVQTNFPVSNFQTRLQKLLELVQLPERVLHSTPRELSGGQRQRAVMMRALLPEPSVLILDEPLSALDSETKQMLRTDMSSLLKQGQQSLLLITHDLADADAMADTVYHLKDGKLVQDA